MLSVLVPLATIPPLDLRALGVRPELSGPIEVQAVDEFRIHFTREGRDAPDTADDDGNGLPDVVDAVAAGLQLGRDAYITEGWPELVPDGGGGGDDGLDVYLRRLPVNGYAYPLPQFSGSTSCFMEIDPQVPTTGDIIQSVAVHELHHCIQFGYSTSLPPWLYEAASTYEQFSHVESPLLDVALNVLFAEELATMNTPLGTDAGANDPYTSFLFMKLWTEYRTDAPDLGRLPELWSTLADHDDWQVALDAASRNTFELPLDVVHLIYGVWNGFACANDDGAHYGDSTVRCGANATVPLREVEVGAEAEVRTEGGPFTATYLEAVADRSGAVAFSCEGRGHRSGAMVVRDGALVQLTVALPGVEPSPLLAQSGDQLRAVVTGVDETLDATCRWQWESPSPEPMGCSTVHRHASRLRIGAGGPGPWFALALFVSWRRRKRREAGPR